MKLTGAQILCESLINEGVDVVFGFPGGVVLPLYDTLPQYPQLRHILVRHEQCAAHSADAYARVTGRVGVCFATSGPGATNLVTGIANAHLDSVPIVAITGQVARPLIGKDGFQEVDIIGITVPITKFNYTVRKAEDIAKTIKEAFFIASTGRPGPVLIDIPKDVFEEMANFNYPAKINLPGYDPSIKDVDGVHVTKAAKLINEAKRPIIIAGHGISISKAHGELKELAERAQIPVVNTFLGIGCFPESHVLSFGMLGMHGMAYANMAVDAADLIIAIGMRFDDRATANVAGFAKGAQIIHIDIDPAEIGKNLKTAVPIIGDAKAVLSVLNEQIEAQSRIKWIQQIEEWQQQNPCKVRETEELIPQFVIRQISEAAEGKATIVTGVGQHQMWAAHHCCYDRPNSFISSGGLGTMGFELPAAIGAKVGLPNDLVWTICGDGGFQMTMQELATAVQDNIGIKIAIMNNGFLGMVRQWQDMFYDRNYVATPLFGPDFVKIAEAYGIPALRVESKADVLPAIHQAMDTPGPFLIDFRVQGEENVYPMVAPGASIKDVIVDPSLDDAALPGKKR